MTNEPKYPEVREAYRGARSDWEQRHNQRFAQGKLADRVGCTRRHLIRIENGEHRPSPELRDRIAEALEVKPEVLPAAEIAPFRSAA